MCALFCVRTLHKIKAITNNWICQCFPIYISMDKRYILVFYSIYDYLCFGYWNSTCPRPSNINMEFSQRHRVFRTARNQITSNILASHCKSTRFREQTHDNCQRKVILFEVRSDPIAGPSDVRFKFVIPSEK